MYGGGSYGGRPGPPNDRYDAPKVRRTKRASRYLKVPLCAPVTAIFLAAVLIRQEMQQPGSVSITAAVTAFVLILLIAPYIDRKVDEWWYGK